MGRFRRGWELTKRSWAVLRSHPSLMRFPIFGALATLLPAAFLVLPGIFLFDSNETAPAIALLAVGLYVAVFSSSASRSPRPPTRSSTAGPALGAPNRRRHLPLGQ